MRLNKIYTKDKQDGGNNGWILPIYKDYEIFFRNHTIKFIYASCIAPHAIKGPHLHKKRTCMLVPIVGSFLVITKIDGKEKRQTLRASDPKILKITPNTPFKILNLMSKESILLNLADHAWKPEDTDNYEIGDWQ